MHNQNRSQESHLTAPSSISLVSCVMATSRPSAKEMLDFLRAVAAAEIERKRRLGHYVVVWQNDRPMLIGEDAPLDP